ncbi:MAG: hypothetical protein M1816_000732 [Peltula sp. TS41687]|nr:MAG: hypothetical protein M1816_000732 [Peltula sp. TS41687]
MDAPNPPPAYEGGTSKAFDEIGISVLLNRLKQSIASARDFAAFLKKRSSLEEEHAQDLKKLCRTTHEGIKRPEHRQGSYAQQFDEFTRIHERMADHGLQFAQSLHQMHDELVDVTNSSERGRKHWKNAGLTAEKRVQDAETAMDKAKSKYDSLAEDYDRARTGDRQSGKKFGLKGPRSAAQLEEDLQRKVQASDSDYSAKVQAANAQRQELLSSLRPQGVRALQELIRECDSSLTMQMQRFATLKESFILDNGMSVSPIKPQVDGQAFAVKSLKEVVSQIDNDRDLHNYVISHASKVSSKPSEFKYERHPTLAPQQQPIPSTVRQQQTSGLPQQPLASFPMQQPQPSRNVSYDSQPPQLPHPQLAAPSYNQSPTMGTEKRLEIDSQQPHQPFHQTISSGSPIQYGIVPQNQPTPPASNGAPHVGDLPPLKPVFGKSLEDLYRRDESAVPIIVYQCLQAVDLYGLEVEGIYRLSGTASHVARIKAMFDHDSALVDFRNPENFLHDVNSVAGALKQFFRDLPDPLMTREHYSEFIAASRIDDDVFRRDSLHAVINKLPDPNYATLRALILLSVSGPNIADAGWQARAIDTILQNTYQIFDDD